MNYAGRRRGRAVAPLPRLIPRSVLFSVIALINRALGGSVRFGELSRVPCAGDKKNSRFPVSDARTPRFNNRGYKFSNIRLGEKGSSDGCFYHSPGRVFLSRFFLRFRLYEGAFFFRGRGKFSRIPAEEENLLYGGPFHRSSPAYFLTGVHEEQAEGITG